MAKANVVNTQVVPEQTRVFPFYDDYDESKNFHRILFRPGYAVQARELTQLQTILQNQIERFGKHIFVDGSSVVGGDLDITNITTLNVQSLFANNEINISSFKDKTIRLSSGNNDVIARVVQTSERTETSPPALHIKYLSGTEFSAGDTISTVSDNVSVTLATSNHSSNGTVAFLYDSIYFILGHFVKTPSQTVVVSKYSTDANVKVGLELDEQFTNENSDTSLLDPALEASNYQAPGASRYKLELNLSTRSLDSEDDSRFIQIATIENGIIKNIVKNPIYSEIEEVLARRTYDESGNYIVKPFVLKIEDSQVDPANNFTAFLSPGKAYLYGFETEIQSELSLEIPRARDFANVTNYDLNMNYGNYVIVDDLTGNFNIRMGVVDLHCVEKSLVNTSTSSTYNSTKIGTARIRDLEFFSGEANTAERKYELYFVDNKFTRLSGIAGDSSVALNQIDLSTANTSSVDGAYKNSFIRITSGTSAGDERLIVSYNGSTRIANVEPAFTTTTDNTSNYLLSFDIKVVDSFYQTTAYTPSATSNASASVSLTNKVDGDRNNITFITESNFLTSFFSYPDAYIRPGITNQSYRYRRVYNTIQFTNGESSVITASTDEDFVGTTSSSNIASTVTDNWLVVVTDPQTSSRNVGDQVLITTSITTSTPEQATLFSGNTSESFLATVYAKVDARDSATTPRVKTLVLANTQLFTSETASNTFVNSTGSTTTVYPNSGQVVISNPSGTEAESLYISDVLAAVKIYSTPNLPNANTSLISSCVDITNRYIVDSGQKPTHYDHASIRLKPGFANPKGNVIVCLRYYKSTNDVGYFSVDSYPSLNNVIIEEGRNLDTGYTLIPKINNTKLSDVIDFRPVRPNSSNAEFYAFSSARIPVATTDFRSNYSYFLERWDTLILNLDQSIQRVEGQSSRNPTFPTQPERSLLLHRLRIKPYTETTRDIIINSINHRRYTMSDIQKIDRRLKNVEYSVSLNSLEKRAEDILIKDVDGLDRTKFGILAENFRSHILGDTSSPDYSCSIDINRKFTPRDGMMMPRTYSREVDLDLDQSLSSNVSVHDGKILLSYTTVPAIQQDVATKTTPVCEYLYSSFRGSIICNPEADIWKDTTVLPPTVISIPAPISQPRPDEPRIPVIQRPVPNPIRVNPGVIGSNISIPIIIDSGETIIVQVPLPEVNINVERLVVQSNTDVYSGLGQIIIDPVTFEVSYINASNTGYSTIVSNDVAQTIGMSEEQFYNYITQAVNGTGLFDTLVSPSRDLVDQVYNNYFEILGRPPEGTGATYWVSSALYLGLSEQELLQNMTLGAIYSGELVDPVIQQTSVVNLTPTKIFTGDDFSYNSAEAYNNIYYSTTAFAGVYTSADSGGTTRDPTPETLITELYQNYLGRDPDSEGLEYWLSVFEAGEYSAETALTIAGAFAQVSSTGE